MERLKEIKNGAPVPNTFSAAEYERRLTALRTTMADEKINAVLYTSIHNINYYCDFLYCSFGRPYGLAITDTRAVSFSAGIDGGQPGRRTVGENLVYTDWQHDNYFRAAKRVLPPKGVLGVEFDHINLENMEKLRAAFPDCQFKDIGKSTIALTHGQIGRGNRSHQTRRASMRYRRCGGVRSGGRRGAGT